MDCSVKFKCLKRTSPRQHMVFAKKSCGLSRSITGMKPGWMLYSWPSQPLKIYGSPPLQGIFFCGASGLLKASPETFTKLITTDHDQQASAQCRICICQETVVEIHRQRIFSDFPILSLPNLKYCCRGPAKHFSVKLLVLRPLRRSDTVLPWPAGPAAPHRYQINSGPCQWHSSCTGHSSCTAHSQQVPLRVFLLSRSAMMVACAQW